MGTVAGGPVTMGTRTQSVGAPPSRRARIVVGLVVGFASGVLAFAFHARPEPAPDFIYPWTAARMLVAGGNPYTTLPGGMAHPFEAPLLYPLPAVLVTVPLAPLSLPVAVAVFMGISSLLLAYALSRDGWDRMVLFVSTPFILAIALGQWSPLLTAAALLPSLGFLAIAKPNLGLALTIYRPSLPGLIGCALLLALSMLVLPTWPHDWARSLSLDHQSGTHLAPIATPLGFVLALALLRWRRPETRLLLAMACVPQLLFFYDQLPLMLVAETRQERYALAASSGAAFLAWMVLGHGSAAEAKVAEWCVMLGIYLPCLIMTLRRPNEADAPAWIELDRARHSECAGQVTADLSRSDTPEPGQRRR